MGQSAIASSTAGSAGAAHEGSANWETQLRDRARQRLRERHLQHTQSREALQAVREGEQRELHVDEGSEREPSSDEAPSRPKTDIKQRYEEDQDGLEPSGLDGPLCKLLRRLWGTGEISARRVQ